MSTSLLYHGFGIRGVEYKKTEYQGGKVRFWIEPKPESICCATCHSRNVYRRGQKVRRFRTTPIGRKPVELLCHIPRVSCKDCGELRQIAIPFADPRRTYTRTFERYALDLCRSMTIQDAAQHLGISWDVIKGIVKRDLQRRFDLPL